MTERKLKKIAFHLNCLGHGGAERVVSNLANRFAKEGYHVFVATEWEDAKEYALLPEVERVHVGLRPQEEGKGRTVKFLLRIRYLHAFLEEYRPDVIVAFAQRALYRALEACKGTGVPVVIAPRIHPVGNYDHLSDRIQMRLFFHRVSGAVFQTQEMQDFFSPRLSCQTTVIMNPVSESFAFATPLPPIRNEVVHAARLVEFKNQVLLVRAFVRVHARHPDTVFRIYGADGGEGTEQRIRSEIEKNRAQKYIFLMGESNMLEKELPGAACFAYSSDYEGMPNALMEAMALGLPVVSTDCPPGGARAMIVPGQNGLLVPVGDEKKLADGICYLLEHPEEATRMGERAREITKTAGLETIFRQWETYLAGIAGWE